MTIKKANLSDFEIQDYSFTDISDLSDKVVKSSAVIEKDLRSNFKPSVIKAEQEVRDSEKSGFQIESHVENFRAHDEFKRKYLEREVAEKVQEIQKKAYEEAFAQGLKDGKEQALAESLKNNSDFLNNELETLNEFVNEVKLFKQKILAEHQDNLLNLTKNISKWILDKESENEKYFSQLLKQLLLKVEDGNKLKVSLDSESYEKYQNIITQISNESERFKSLKFVRNSKLKNKSIKVESDYLHLDGSLDKIFDQIDILFEEYSNASGL